MYSCQEMTAIGMSCDYDILLMTNRRTEYYHISYNFTTEDETRWSTKQY
jgi:hypothetical protein